MVILLGPVFLKTSISFRFLWTVVFITTGSQSKLPFKDLNNDGADEIGFWDIKPTTKSLYVFNALNGSLLCAVCYGNFIGPRFFKNINKFQIFMDGGIYYNRLAK